jgi:hypothetical protein
METQQMIIYSAKISCKEDGGSAERGDIPDEGLSTEAPTQVERDPPDGLEESDVGPVS